MKLFRINGKLGRERVLKENVLKYKLEVLSKVYLCIGFKG